MSLEKHWDNCAGGNAAMSTYLDDDCDMGVIQFNGGKRPMMVHLDAESLGLLIDALLEIREELLADPSE
jgi:hypothetical protein